MMGLQALILLFKMYIILIVFSRDPQKLRGYGLDPEGQIIMADATGTTVGTVTQPDDVLARDFRMGNLRASSTSLATVQ